MSGRQNNKKIKNAHPLQYDNIKFKSQLEKTVYVTLKEQGISARYEPEKIVIWEGFNPTVPFLTKNTFKRKNRYIRVLSDITVEDGRTILNWTYSPDFCFTYNNCIVYIEAKGFKNDVVRYKSKLFREHLEKLQKDNPEVYYEFWEIYTKRQLLECINNLKKRKYEYNKGIESDKLASA